jgi:hypothetical protein
MYLRCPIPKHSLNLASLKRPGAFLLLVSPVHIWAGVAGVAEKVTDIFLFPLRWCLEMTRLR